jgi:plasmid stabilization system protein ParE
MSDMFDISSTQTTLYKPTRYIQDTVKADLELIATYLAKKRVPSPVQAVLSQVQNMYSRHVVQANKNSTEQAIRQLQTTVQQLVTKVRDIPNRPTGPSLVLYTEAAKLGLPTQTCTQQSLNATHVIPQKPVPIRHKQEIIVVRGTEMPEEKARSYKELLEQLNSLENAGEAVAIRRLPTGDMTLTIEDKQACTNWLKDTK